MKRSNMYTINYRMDGTWSDEKTCYVLASNKAEAYDKAVFEEIPKLHSYSPYSVWVSGVTYQNGNYHAFNTCEGLGY